MNDFVIRSPDRKVIVNYIDIFASLYRYAYFEEPYNETEEDVVAFTERFGREICSSGFDLAIAEIGERVVGFAYGLTFGPHQWWGGAHQAPRDMCDVSKFAVMELVVHHTERRRGIATALMRHLLMGRNEPCATLCCHPDAPACQIYQQWGWAPVASLYQRQFQTMMNIMVLSLRQ